MALWQFDFYFIPIGAHLPDTTGEEWDEPGLALSKVRTVQEALAYYFGPPWVMLDDWLVFGPENGNRVDVHFDDDLSASIFVRCDIRTEAPQFLALIVELARKVECEFYSADSKGLISADFQALTRESFARRERLPRY